MPEQSGELISQEMDSPVASAELVIEDLRLHPQLLEVIARWHQQEWQQDNLPRRIEQLQVHIDDDSLPLTLVALRQGFAVGSVSLVRYRKLGGYPASVWMANLYVHPQWRTQGIGSRLVLSAESQALARGEGRLYLYTHDQQSYYQKRQWRMLKQHQFAGQATTIMARELDALGETENSTRMYDVRDQ